MMDRKNREILELLSESRYITAEELGNRLSLSEKTVRTRLHELKTILSENGAQIVSKPRYGYSLMVTDSKLWLEFCADGQKINSHIPINSEERVDYILAKLMHLKPGEFIKIEQLSEQLYVSSKTLTGELRRIKYILEQFSLSLDSRPHYGICIVGREFNKRCCILKNFPVGSGAFLKDSEWEQQAQKIAAVFLRLIRQYHIRFTEVSFQKTICYIQLSLLRIQQGFLVEDAPENAADIFSECEMSCAFYHELLTTEIPQEEIFYTGIYIAGKRIMGVGRESDNDLANSPQLDHTVTRIFETLYQTYGVDFRKNLNLRVLLLQHLRPMLIRLKYDIPVEMCADEIKGKYFFCYTMAQLAAKILEQEFGKPLPEEELLCLSIYFALAMDERSSPDKRKNNILLVCVSGKASVQLLVHHFKKEFGDEIGRLKVCSLYDFDHVDLKEIDLIFSTVPLYKPVPVPVMQIRDFFDGQDVVSIRRFLENSTRNVIDLYFRPELFFTEVPGNTKEEVLHTICSQIKKEISLPEGFEDAVLQREAMGSTDFGNLCAIPHPCRLMTHESFAAVAVLQRPILWQRNPVQVVMLVSLTNEVGTDNQEFYGMTADFLCDEAAVRQLIREPSFSAFRKILTGLKR